MTIRSALLAVALVAATGCSAAPRSDAKTTTSTVTPSYSPHRVQEAVVRLRNVSCGLAVGSGFALSPTQIITNRHVVDGASEIQIDTWDGHSGDATSVDASVYEDLAVLTVPVPIPSVVPVERAPAHAGEPVHVVGFPEGGPYTVTSGRIIDIVHDDSLGPGAIIRTNANVEHGNSGGPLIDDRGRVVGVVYAIQTSTGYGLAIPTATLRSVLDDAAGLEAVTPDC